ncbi:MAG: hypothetical protein M0P97_04675, partial [Candidatus Moranbacteria bacterium]|nr:hypothetical protein [Candidatus Moranbacteria bacterium]
MGKILDAFLSLGKSTNKVKNSDQEIQQGVFELEEEMRLDMPDDELIDLAETWEKKWNDYYPVLKKIEEKNENYWRGKHFANQDDENAVVDNLIFESLETFLPIATKQNPEPVVTADNTDEGEALASKVSKMLIYQADTNRLKLRLKKVVRFWAMYRRGVMKMAWSMKKNDIKPIVLRPQRLILDPDGIIDDDMTYDGEYIGENKKEKASDLIARFPQKEAYIKEYVKEKLGTRVPYQEWHTDEYSFWKLGNEILGKMKNPNWNWPEEKTETDEFGGESVIKIPGRNHFNTPQKPYIFLSIFNLGKHPHDDTSLIEQNIANQDIINKRNRQIDDNVDDMNGGWVISGDSGLTAAQASEAVQAVREGGAIYIPTGNSETVVSKKVGSGLPSDVYNQLIDVRNELRNIFGTRGSTPQGTSSEPTVRGKMIVREQDSSRIGGGVSEYLEQFADQVFNWMVQMMYVHYDEKHIGSIIGKDSATEFVELINSELDRKLMVSVKEGSMIPKDSLTKANQATDLSSAGLMDPITLYDKLDYPNPYETAE